MSGKRLLGQFSHLSIVDLFPLSQLGGKKLGHDVLEQNCGVVLPVSEVLEMRKKKRYYSTARNKQKTNKNPATIKKIYFALLCYLINVSVRVLIDIYLSVTDLSVFD